MRPSKLAAGDHVETNIGVAVVDPLRPLLPVMTGKTTTRKRSTRPAFKRERHMLRLPMVRRNYITLVLHRPHPSTASCDTNRVFDHGRGPLNVVEKTTLENPARTSVPGSPWAASADITR